MSATTLTVVETRTETLLQTVTNIRTVENGATVTIAVPTTLIVTSTLSPSATSNSSNQAPPSAATIAGVVIGVVTLVCLLLALLFILIRRWRKQKQKRSVKDPEHQAGSLGSISPLVTMPASDSHDNALKKENLALQEKIREMTESMTRMQRQLDHRPQPLEITSRESVRSQISEGPPEYQRHY
ncbi:hypothetical protein DL96DRAFT_1617041, partial [Flagelloscypha sp. PMI_526]